MATNTPLILISNDDGVDSKGLRELIDAVSGFGAEIIAVAPMEQHSGQSSAITVTGALRIKQHPDYGTAKIYSVSGTPVDCVKLAMHHILPRRPDYMLSGINHGSNAGNCAIYSGTMGAAMEACMYGIPAVAFSLLSHNPEADFSGVRRYVTDITARVLASGLPADICLNVNMPARCKPKGVKVVRAATGYWNEEYQRYVDPSGRDFFMLSGSFVNSEPECDATDEYWLSRQYITIVPVRPDQSALDTIGAISAIVDGID